MVLVLFGTLALGQYINIGDSAKNIGVFGTSTATAVEWIFFLILVSFVWMVFLKIFS